MNHPPELHAFRVLVVDDNPSIHEDIRKILCPELAQSAAAVASLAEELFGEVPPERRGKSFTLDSAFQGEEALELVRRSLAENRPYSLAFVDIRMPPGWDGIETIRRVWEICPRLQAVVCTAYSDYSWDQMHAKLGQPDGLVVLKKPFDNVEVQQLAHALTRKWELNLQAKVKMEELESLVLQRTAALEKANLDLARSEERFAKAFHTSPVPMAIESLPDRRFVDVNEQMAQLIGYTHKQIVGKCASGLSLWQTPHQVEEWFAALLGNEAVRDRETELRSQCGSRRQVLVSLSLVTLSGQPHALVVVQDLTERNMLERQLHQAQKMEAVGQLAAGIAHDFNNILTVIEGHAGLVKEQLAAGHPALESADEIEKASDRAAGLVRQLLMFSRKQVMKCHHLDLNEAVNNSLAMVGRLVGEHIRMHFTGSPGLPVIHADPTMIEQIIMNLAVNARDAMPNGGIVTLATDVVTVNRQTTPMDPERRDGRFVRLSFADTGCGMDTSTLNRIFEPFFTTKGVGQGTGLGLSTVFGIVRQHHGWIEASSKPGHGTAFELYFPASAEPAEKTSTCSDQSVLQRGQETVLLAEDEEALRVMVTRVLKAQGYKVLAAASGVEALRLYEEANTAIDLLMTDMVMPGGVMGGELAKRLRAANPRLKVIYTSGYSPGMAGKDISLLEGRNFLPKPYSIGKLVQVVREVLSEPAQVGQAGTAT
jgi:two-component system, cell cycle sensor histidine kinase and response regulator CckA